MQDEKLIELILDGDDNALRQLHDRYVNQIFRYAYTQLGDYYQAEEVTQDIVFKMAQNLASFKGKATFKTWLFAIGRRVVIDYHRKNKKHQNNVMVETEKMDGLIEPYPSVEDEVVQKSSNEQLLSCIQQLAQNDRMVIHLRFIEGFSVAETAKVMSKTSLAVKSLQVRAKKKLAELMRKEVVEYEG